MAELTKTQKEMMNRLYNDYGLSKDDIFEHRHYKIITRAGIDKIMAKSDIKITYNPVYINRFEDGLDVAVKAVATMGNEVIETFGEASPENTTQNYPFAMAEKRAMSRAVLKLAGLYSEGFFGEDESDDFKKSRNTTQSAVVDKRK